MSAHHEDIKRFTEYWNSLSQEDREILVEQSIHYVVSTEATAKMGPDTAEGSVISPRKPAAPDLK